MDTVSRLVFCVAFVLIAGCSASVDYSKLSQTVQPNSIRADVLDLSNCDFLLNQFDVPIEVDITDPFGNWSKPDGVSYDLYTDALHCERIALGPFERGPINVIFDRHNYQIEPEKCQEGRVGDLGVIAMVFVDDQEIVDYMVSVLRMPAQFATIAVEETRPTPASLKQQWTWSVPGYPESFSGGSVLVAPFSDSSPFKERQYWDMKPGVGVMEWEDSGPIWYPAGELVPVRLSPPNLYSRLGVSDSTPVGTYEKEHHLHAPIRMYGDYECEHLL